MRKQLIKLRHYYALSKEYNNVRNWIKTSGKPDEHLVATSEEAKCLDFITSCSDYNSVLINRK
jgi:hypothetical protein